MARVPGPENSDRRRGRPREHRWATALAARNRPISWPRRDMRLASTSRAKLGGLAVERAWPSGGSFFLQPTCTRKIGLTSPPLGIGRPSVSPCVLLHCLVVLFGFLRAPTSAVSAPSARQEVDKSPKVEVRLTNGVVGRAADNANRCRRPAPRRRSRSGQRRTSSRVGPGDSLDPLRGRGLECVSQGRESANSPRLPDYLPASSSPGAVLPPPRDHELPSQHRGGYRERASTPAPMPAPCPPQSQNPTKRRHDWSNGWGN